MGSGVGDAGSQIGRIGGSGNAPIRTHSGLCSGIGTAVGIGVPEGDGAGVDDGPGVWLGPDVGSDVTTGVGVGVPLPAELP